MNSYGGYYQRRASQEAQRAARAVTQQAREWHQELSERFARQAGQSAS